jgi:hypothetical protein
MGRAKNKFVMSGFNAGAGTGFNAGAGTKPPTNYGKSQSPILSTDSDFTKSLFEGQKQYDSWYENNPLPEDYGQEGVQYNPDGIITGGWENYESEASYDYDLGKNFYTDRWGKVHTGSNKAGEQQRYTLDQAGYDLAQKDAEYWMSKSGKRDEIPDYLKAWKAEQDNPGATTSGGGDMINQNMQDVDVSGPGTSSGSGAPSGPKPPSARDLKRANYNEAKDVIGGKPGWRQSRRLLGGGAKSDRQLKRIKRQQRRKDQRAKNRRERGWGGFGWNWRKNR